MTLDLSSFFHRQCDILNEIPGNCNSDNQKGDKKYSRVKRGCGNGQENFSSQLIFIEFLLTNSDKRTIL